MRKRCNSNDAVLCCTQVAKGLHAKLGAQHASCWSAAPQDVRLRRGLPVRVAFALRRVAFRPGHGRPPGTEAAPPDSAVPDAGAIWGFCTIRSLSSACRRRVAPLMVQFPPFAGGVIGRQAAPGASCSAILPFGGALDVGRARPCASNGAIPPVWWGFCTIRSLSSACRRRVAALLTQFPHPLLQQEDGVRRVAALLAQFPPFAGSEVAVRGGEVTVCSGEAPTSPTTSPKNADNGGLRARCPASWWQRCLASCVARTRTAEYAR